MRPAGFLKRPRTETPTKFNKPALKARRIPSIKFTVAAQRCCLRSSSASVGGFAFLTGGVGSAGVFFADLGKLSVEDFLSLFGRFSSKSLLIVACETPILDAANVWEAVPVHIASL